MKIQIKQLRKLINEVVSETLPERGTSFQIENAFKEFVSSHPELLDDPQFADGMDNINYIVSYDDLDSANVLCLGSIQSDGGDYMYDAIESAGLLHDLQQAIEKRVSASRPATKRPRKFKIIPYTENKWNEDKWGNEL